MIFIRCQGRLDGRCTPTSLLQNIPYTYTGDNPVDFGDPTGKSAFTNILGGIAGILGGAAILTGLYAFAPYGAEAPIPFLLVTFGFGVGVTVLGVVLLGLAVYEAA